MMVMLFTRVEEGKVTAQNLGKASFNSSLCASAKADFPDFLNSGIQNLRHEIEFSALCDILLRMADKPRYKSSLSITIFNHHKVFIDPCADSHLF